MNNTFPNLTPLPWMDDALCTQVDPDLWFPEEHNNGAAAKKICAQCPVATECRQYGVDNAFEYGIYGGTNARSRRRYRDGTAA